MKTREIKWHMIFLIIILLQLFPLIYMLSISFKDMEQIFADPLKLIPERMTFENYIYIWKNVPIVRYIWNTFFISAGITAGKIVTSIMAAYVLTYKKFKGKNSTCNSII